MDPMGKIALGKKVMIPTTLPISLLLFRKQLMGWLVVLRFAMSSRMNKYKKIQLTQDIGSVCLVLVRPSDLNMERLASY